MKKFSLVLSVLLMTAAPVFAQSTMSSSSTTPPKPGLFAKLKAMKHKPGTMSSTTAAPGSKMGFLAKLKAKHAMQTSTGSMMAPTTSGSAASAGAPMAASTPGVMSKMTGGMGKKVWVNLKDGVYHYPGDKYYGKTKKGEFLSESVAIKDGYRAAGKK